MTDRLDQLAEIESRICAARRKAKAGETGRLDVYIAALISRQEGLALDNPFCPIEEPGLGDAWQWFVERVLLGRRDAPAAREVASPAYADLVGGGA